MRTYITAFLIMISASIFGQGNSSIADTSKIWNTIFVGYASWGLSSCQTTTHWFITPSNSGGEYLDVLESSDSLRLEWDVIGSIREDTSTKQVFFRLGDNEGLIYDFSLETGDTVEVNNLYTYYHGISLMKVDSTDSIFIAGEMRKRYFLNTVYSPSYYPVETWIEGIGSLFGLMHSGIGAYPFGGGDLNLLCLSRNDTAIYMNPRFFECYYDTFFPQILNNNYPTAYLNTYYEFQLQVSVGTVSDYSISGAYIPPGFTFDTVTWVLSGTPTQTGSYTCIILAENNELGLVSDMIYEDINVVLPTDIVSIPTESGFCVYPNPFHSVLTIQNRNNEKSEWFLEIYSTEGILLRKVVFKGSFTIDFNDLSSGIYLLRIKGRKGFPIYQQSIVKY
jgi:hypothetical protein